MHNFFLLAFFSADFFVGYLLGQATVFESNTSKIYSFRPDFLPEQIPPIKRSCYSVGYDSRNKNAAWVYERITAKDLNGDAKRIHCKFKEDDRIPSIFRSTLEDYRGSGFDRGHLAPAGNHKNSLEEMQDTFFLSNMAPQNPQFNRGYWSKLEKHVRDLTCSCPVVHVYTGPLYLPTIESDGSKWIKYKVIGENNVGVPTHFFKILILENASGDVTCEGYVLPNEPIHLHTPMNDFKTTIEKIEKASGIIFQAHKD